MPLSREEHAAFLAAILANPADVAIVSDNVTQLSENYAALIAESALKDANIAQLSKSNTDLIDQNMKLFLKVGTVADKPIVEDVVTTPTYEALFDENGNLK